MNEYINVMKSIKETNKKINRDVKMNQEIFNDLYKQFTNSTKLFQKVMEADKIHNEIRVWEQQEREIRQDYDENLKEIREQIRKIQKSCGHESKKYYPDASGNNDSYYICNICGTAL